MLEAYKQQNPRKYAIKYGDRTIEEILAGTQPEPPKPETTVKVEITKKEELETSFAEELPEVEAPAPKKRGRKPKSQE